MAFVLHNSDDGASICQPLCSSPLSVPVQSLVHEETGALLSLPVCRGCPCDALVYTQWRFLRPPGPGQSVHVAAGSLSHVSMSFSFQFFIPKIIVMYVITLIGGFFYVSQFPEKIIPGD